MSSNPSFFSEYGALIVGVLFVLVIVAGIIAITRKRRKTRAKQQAIEMKQIKPGVKTKTKTKTKTKVKVGEEETGETTGGIVKDFFGEFAKHWVLIIIALVIGYVLYNMYTSGFLTCTNSKGKKVKLCIPTIGSAIEKFGGSLTILLILGIAGFGALGVFRAAKKAYDERQSTQKTEEAQQPIEEGTDEALRQGGMDAEEAKNATDDPPPPTGGDVAP